MDSTPSTSNAWQEDFRRDPLVAILGQIHQKFRNYSGMRETLKEIGIVTGKLLLATGNAVIKARIGLDIEGMAQAVTPENPLEDYQAEGESQEQLRRALERLAQQAHKQTGQPLVFIVDELDRCRPAFAVECLERIKHLLEIPNIVFILGVNRDELRQSIRHVNGEIDASTYLQRFFDLEFNLPPAKTWNFCMARLKEHGVTAFYDDPSADDAQEIFRYHNFQGNLFFGFSMLLEGMALSLRETEQCVRIIALAVRLIDWEEPPHLKLLGTLALLKVKNPVLFRGLAEGSRPNIVVVNYIQNTLIENGNPVVEDLRRELIGIEIHLAEANSMNDPNAARQLVQVCNGSSDLQGMEALSQRLKETEKRELEAIRRNNVSPREPATGRPLFTQSIDRVVGAIELVGGNSDFVVLQ